MTVPYLGHHLANPKSRRLSAVVQLGNIFSIYVSALMNLKGGRFGFGKC